MLILPLMFLIITEQIFFSLEKTISYNTEYEFSLLKADFSFQSLKNINSLPLNIGINYTWISEFDFNNTFPSKEGNVSSFMLDVRNKKYFATKYEGDLIINRELTIKGFRFLSLRIMMFFTLDKGYGLGLNFNDEKMSIVHQLFNQGYIDKKSFTFDLTNVKENNNLRRTMLHFGDIPLKSLSKVKYIFKIRAKDNLVTWGNVIKNIFFLGKEYEINRYGYFQTCGYHFISSKYFVDFFIDNIAKAHINQNKGEDQYCKLKKMKRNEVNVECKDRRIGTWPPIVFRFEEFNMSLSIALLFDHGTTDYFSSKFIYSEERTIEDFEFGFPFLKMFSLISFDYESKEILFYQIDDDKIFSYVSHNLFYYDAFIYLSFQLIIYNSMFSIYLLIVTFIHKKNKFIK